MKEILSIVNDNIAYILIGLFIINIITFIIIFINNKKVKRLVIRNNKLTNDLNDNDLEKIIINYYDKVENIMKKNKEIEIELMKIKKMSELYIQKIGVVRYNAFSDVGSDLSFTVAILDKNDNGFVLNGIYSRESSTTYCKPIQNLQCKYTLSAEEIQAIDVAKKNYNEKEYFNM